MKTFILIIIFSLIWVALSGYFDFLLLSFGVFSVLLVVFVLRRMSSVDDSSTKLDLKILKSIRYFLWLMLEILKSNYSVCKIVLSPKININQNMFEVPLEPKGESGQVVFANSITLTPGTITVETMKDSLMVHSLDFNSDTMGDINKMGKMVADCEIKGVE